MELKDLMRNLSIEIGGEGKLLEYVRINSVKVLKWRNISILSID